MRWIRRGVIVAVLMGALAYLPWLVYRSEGFQRYRKLERERAELERGNQELGRKNRALRRDIHRLRHDLDAVGAVARDELGLVGPDEMTVVVAGDRSEPGP